MTKKNGDNTESSKLLCLAIVGTITIFILWVVSGFVIYNWLPGDGKHGTFGDMFGAINALFSGLAFLGVIVAILLQKEELEEQRKEIRQAREAHQATAKSLEKQAATQQLHTRLEALNHVIDALESKITRLGAEALGTRKTIRERLVIKRENYETKLQQYVDEFLDQFPLDGNTREENHGDG